MMDQLLANCTDFAAAYLDDVVIHSSSWEDHVSHIRSILQRLREAGLMIKTQEVPVWDGKLHVPGTCGWKWWGSS